MDDSGIERHDGPESDDALDDIVAGYIDRLNSGEMLDADAVRADHPEIEDIVLDRLETFGELSGAAAPDPTLCHVGDFHLLKEIGRGGMGVVYEAWQESVERPVALKVLPAAMSADSRRLARFVREAKIAAKLHHQNIVPIYDMGVAGDVPHFAMELVEGRSLAAIIAGRARRPTKATPAECYSFAEWFAGVAAGLQHAHAHGIVHRDIKPSNLILEHAAGASDDAARLLRVLDFGLANFEDDETLTLTGEVIGTPVYMSPEQTRRHEIKIDHRTDVYSLGATFYELLTGEPPIRGRDYDDTLSRIVTQEPRPVSALAPRVPRDLETIVMKCLRKNRSERYGTAEALEQDLHRFVRGDPIEARPLSPLERAFSRLRRHRWRIVQATGLGVLLFALGVLMFIWHRGDLASRRRAYEAAVHRALVEIALVEYALPPGVGALDQSPELERSGVESFAVGLEQTLAELDRVDALLGGGIEASYYRARGLRLLGRREEALAEVQSVLERQPQFVPAELLERSLLRVLDPGSVPADTMKVETVDDAWRRGAEALSIASWAAARDAYTSVLDARGEEPFVGFRLEALLARARARIGLEDVRAIEDLGAIVELWSDVDAARLFLARAYHVAGERELADTLFEALWKKSDSREAVVFLVLWFYIERVESELWPTWIERIGDEAERERMRAKMLEALGHGDDQIAAAKRAFAIDAGPKGYSALARAHYGASGYAGVGEAAAITHDGLDRYPDSPLLRCDRSHWHFRRGRHAEGERVAEALVKDYPYYAEAFEALAINRLRLRKVEAAIAAIDRAIALAPTTGYFYSDRAWIHYCAGQLDRTFDTATIDRNISPEGSWWPYLMRGKVFERRGQIKEAVAELEIGSGLPVFDPVIQYHHGWVLELAGRKRDAFLAFAHAFEKRPGNGADHYRLCCLLREEPLFLEATDVSQLVESLEREARRESPSWRAVNLLAIIRQRVSGESAVDLGSLLDRLIGASKRPDPDAVATLGEIALREGRSTQALALLDCALELPHASRFVRELREACATAAGAEEMRGSGDGLLSEGVRAAMEKWRTERDAERTEDERWLAGLDDNPERTLRLNSGGGPIESASGELLWHRDRFNFGGWHHGRFVLNQLINQQAWSSYAGPWKPRFDPYSFQGAISGTDTPYLYRTHRFFERHDVDQGYRIPLAAGDYELTFHFAEVWYQAPGMRRFDIAVEGETLIADLDVFAAVGFAAPLTHRRPVPVTDGRLDVVFVPRIGYPMVSGIEILPMQ